MSVTIEAEAIETMDLPCTLDEAWALIGDVTRSSSLIPDMEICEEIEPDVWRYRYKAIGFKGFSYQPTYTARYTQNPPTRTEWKAIDGNLRQSGHWTLEAAVKGTHATLKVNVVADMPIPRLLVPVARPLFVETFKSAIRGYVAAIRRELGGR